VNIQRDKALQQRQITFSASELFDLYQSGKDAGGCPGRHGFTTTYALRFCITYITSLTACIEPWGDRFDSSVAFQTQYVRNKILSIAALDYKIRHGAMGGS
jgi:hypothetical protein